MVDNPIQTQSNWIWLGHNWYILDKFQRPPATSLFFDGYGPDPEVFRRQGTKVFNPWSQIWIYNALG